MEVDPRILRIGIRINGFIKYYEDLAISASGSKFANELENECDVKITNLSREMREYLLTETSPFTKKHYEDTKGEKKAALTTVPDPNAPKAATVYSGVRLVLEAGRVSTGYSTVYVGDIISATPSQPPNIDITIKCKTLSNAKLDMVTRSTNGMTKLSVIAKTIAEDLGLKLLFQASDKNISNYSFSGSNSRQIGNLAKLGVNAFVDDDRLVVKNLGSALSGTAQLLNKHTGMIGIPELTETGIKVKYLFNNISTLGSKITVESEMNPVANGTYTIFKLNFDLANRENQFYITAEASRDK